jgi:hypothetical protein
MKYGFTLVEALVYIAGSAILAVAISSIISMLVSISTTRARLSDTYINSWIAHCRIVQDLKTAPGDRSLWKKLGPHEVIWQTIQGSDCGWSLRKARLIRSIGLFNAMRQAWDKRTTSIAADATDQLLFTVEYTDDIVHGVVCTLTRAKNTISCFVCVSG